MEEIKPILKYPQGNNGVIGTDQSVKIDTIYNQTQKLVWETSDEKVIFVDENGNVTGKKEGTAIIRAYYEGNPDDHDELGFTVFNPTNDALDFFVGANVGNILHRQVISFGSDSYEVGEKNFQKDVIGSLSKSFFGELNINESFMEVSEKGGRPGVVKASTDWIIVHDTGNTNKTANAKGHANYLKTNPGLSWHYTVDDHEIYHHVPDGEVAWHAGDGSNPTGIWRNEHGEHLGGGNRNGIGIETCINEGSNLYATWQRCAKLVAKLLRENNLTLDKVKQHHDFSSYNKDCPRTMRNAHLWDHFMELVATEYEALMKYSAYTITIKPVAEEALAGDGRVTLANDKVVSYKLIVSDGQTRFEVRLFGKIL